MIAQNVPRFSGRQEIPYYPRFPLFFHVLRGNNFSNSDDFANTPE